MINYFSSNYEESRIKFYDNYESIKNKWNESEKIIIPIDDLSMDIIHAKPKNYDKVIVITTGQHGIEGYTGSAMINMFIDKFMDKLDEENTGLFLLHSINPWGMKNYRRANSNNIDLNRNFILDWNNFNKDINQNYDMLNNFFELNNKVMWKPHFYMNLINSIKKAGTENISKGITLGQYKYPKGIYYGGSNYEVESNKIIDIFNNLLSTYISVIHIDIHTGYGPRYVMNIMNSTYEPRDSNTLKELYNYEHIIKTDQDEAYAISGDMIDYIYKLRESKYINKYLYSTTFEFGTLGESSLSSIKALEILIRENQLYWDKDNEELRIKLIKKLFYPKSNKWKEHAILNCYKAFNGVLKGENII